jgi:ankyrin repeat protein
MGGAHAAFGEAASWDQRDAGQATPLHAAAEAGQLEVLEQFYQPVPAANAAHVEGEPPVMVGSADPADAFGRNPLDVAVGMKHWDCVRTIVHRRHRSNIAHELDRAATLAPNFQRDKLQDPADWALLHCAAAQGLVSVVQLALERQHDSDGDAQQLNAFARDPLAAHSWTPLMLVASAGGAEGEAVARLLCDAGAAVEVANETGCDALWLAASAGHAAVLRVLLAAGADPRRPDHSGVDGLMAAALSGHNGTLRLLLGHVSMQADSRVRGQESVAHFSVATLSTVLVAGLLHGDEELVTQALELGVDPCALDLSGVSAQRHYLGCDARMSRTLAQRFAAAGGAIEVVSAGDATLALLEHSLRALQPRTAIGAFRRELSQRLQTAVEGSAEWPWMVKALAPLLLEDTGEVAAGHKREGVEFGDLYAEILTATRKLKRGRKTFSATRSAGSITYPVSLHRFVLEDQMGAVFTFWKWPTLKTQVASQVDPLHRTPLMIACGLEKLDWVNLLLDPELLSVGARKRMLDAADIEGHTALHHACLAGSPQCAQLVLAARPQLLERETKPSHATPRELASVGVQQASRQLRAVRWMEWSAPKRTKGEGVRAHPRRQKLKVTVSGEELSRREVELRRWQELESRLSAAGAVGVANRRRRRLGRRLLLVVAMAVAVVAVPVATVGHLLCGTQRQTQELVLRLHDWLHRPAVVSCAVLTLIVAVWSLAQALCTNAGGARVCSVGSSAVVLVMALGAQLLLACRVWFGADSKADPRRARCARTRLRMLGRKPPPRTTVKQQGFDPAPATSPLFGVGDRLRSAAVVLMVLIELPQMMALGRGGVAAVFLGRPDPWFHCSEHPHCAALLSLPRANATNSTARDAICTELAAGSCDVVCGRCDATTPLWALALTSGAAAALAVGWAAVQCGLVALSFGLAGGTLPIRRWLPPLRADMCDPPGSTDSLVTALSHALYLPVQANLLAWLDCHPPMSQPPAAEQTGLAWPWSTGRSSELMLSPPVPCWRGWHARLAPTAALLVFLMHVSVAILPPMLRGGRMRASVYGVPTLSMPACFHTASYSIKLLLLLFTTATAPWPRLTAVAVCVGCLLLALCGILARGGPSEHRWAGRLRCAICIGAAAGSGLYAGELQLCSTGPATPSANLTTALPTTVALVSSSEQRHCVHSVRLVLLAGAVLWVAGTYHLHAPPN